ncbi:Di-copper centre-containing protein [Hypoxylon rubiginosum]|uniref:Di-copper centre-containing protein n=1 Tax=Hypoxylon rubiginosum TaxID=110542 RepID=A0ACB9Z153_9PEZI|nr:Di-copper centre-containing protein [Hypoxylon rubiginosum]
MLALVLLVLGCGTDLTSAEKLGYLNADLCLMSTPARSGIAGAKTLWDELQYAHIIQVPYVHFVGAFLPFHRYFMAIHAHLLKAECNYAGPIPYWNETADVGNINGSAIFDVETGFGGNGTGAGGCIADGPFADLTLHFKEDLNTTDYCVTRSLNDRGLSSASQENIDTCLAAKSFTEIWSCLEGRPHGAGHGGVSGTMVNLFLSPGDPIFYLHHGFLDKLWWDWQVLNLTTRLTEIGGNNTASGRGGFPGGGPPGGGFPGNPFGPGGNSSFVPPPGFNTSNPFPFPGLGMEPNKAFTDYFYDGGNITTLNHTLWSVGIVQNITIGDVMDPRSGFVCIEYL